MTPFPSNELTPSPWGSETEAREEGLGPAAPQSLVLRVRASQAGGARQAASGGPWVSGLC